MFNVLVQDFPASGPTPAFKLLLRGELEGKRGVILDENGAFNRGRFRVSQILLESNSQVFFRAILPGEIDLPAALIDKNEDKLSNPDPTDVKQELIKRFEALRGESFRRLLTIEVEWNAMTALEANVRGAFFDARVDASGAVALHGEAKLALALLFAPNDIVAGVALAEFRATAVVDFGGFTRGVGIVCRIGVAGAATLALELDDLNFSLPELTLPSFDLVTALRLNLPGGTLAGKLGGMFSRLIEGVTVEYTWTPPDPQLVIGRNGDHFLFAVMQGGLQPSHYDLAAGIDVNDLAALTARIRKGSLDVTASGVKLAVHGTGTVFEATLTVSGTVPPFSGERRMGPLLVSWTNVVVKPAAVVDGGKPALRANVTFDRLMLSVADDPTAAIAVAGEIELSLAGAQIVKLDLVEPYPFKLIQQGGAAFLRGAQKILQFLSHVDPPNGDTSKLQQLLEVLAKIASAVAKGAVFIAREIAEIVKAAADLIAAGLVKIAEALGQLLAALAKLVADLQLPSLDVEIRIAIEPLELRQVLITVRGEKADNSAKKLEVLGLTFAIEPQWQPALLVDFVTDPGAYLLLVHGAAANGKFATISTDLWLKRADNTVAPVRDANKQGERDGKDRLITLTLKRKNAQNRLFLLLAGIERGKGVFLRYAGDTAGAIDDIPLPTGTSVSVLKRPFVFQQLDPSMLEFELDFKKDRILSLLGMGEPGKEPSTSGDSFFDRLQKSLGQVVTVEKIENPKFAEDGRKVITAGLVLNVKAAGVSTRVTLGIELDLDTLEVTFTGSDAVFSLDSKRIEEHALGLTWVVEQTDPKKFKDNEAVPMFELAFSGAESGFALNRKNARMELHFDGLSSDGQGVVFLVQEFRVGRGGVDLVATVDDRAVRLNGLDVPFRFNSGRLEIRGSKLTGAVIVGRGQLPPELIGETNCTVALAFAMADGEIVVQSGKVELDKKGEPIVCHATRFTLTITDLDIGFVRDGGYHFYFLVTGSLRFTPKAGELADGLLKHLKDVEISVERTPLTGDPRVLVRHISFQKALNPKKTFSLFNLFTFELRGFGFHPASPKFDGHPAAVNISGQIRFADLGDVMQPKIDFHELWIAPPAAGESLPRIKAEGLGIELQLAGSVKMRGAVLAVDPQTRTVEGGEFAPPGYNTYGFLGEGMLDIPGFCSIEASMGFLEVAKQDDPSNRKKAFFLFLQADKLSVEIPTPIWTFYLREAGFGFGFRYTLAGIKDAENAKSVAQLVRVLDDVSKRQGDLARFSAWKPDVDKDNVTLALRGAFQTYPAAKTFDATREKTAVNPFFFDIVAALRSDFTFLMSARGWLGVNYSTFLANTENLRERPTYRGYLYISAPRSELLLRGIADSKGFIGEDWPEVRKGTPLRRAVESVDWTTTLFIRPGLLHYEVGWPDQLAVRLVDEPNMRVSVRGGMIFRAAEDGLLLGYNIGADAFIRFEGRAGESIGVSLVAELNARFVARVLAFLAANFRDSLVYGLVSLDARLTFSVQAWMDVDLGFTSFTINIGFSFSVQFSAAVELAISNGGVGGRVDARIAVQAFGCTLGVGIGFTFNAGQLDAARARVQRFLAMSITSEDPATPPGIAAKAGDKAIEQNAASASAVHQAPDKPHTDPPAKPDLPKSVVRSPFGRALKATDFFLVLRKAALDPDQKPVDGDFAYGLFVPREAEDKTRGGFYAAPQARLETDKVHTIETNASLTNVKIWKAGTDDNIGGFDPWAGGNRDISVRWNAPIAVPDGDAKTFTLALFFDECYLADTDWTKDANGRPVRNAKKWQEPSARVHRMGDPLDGSREERNRQRDQNQKARAALTVAAPLDERVFQSRSTMLTMFLDQFLALAAKGTRDQEKFDNVHQAHVTDLGLVIYGPTAELEKLDGAMIRKNDDSHTEAGTVTIFNPRKSWFDVQDPVLANGRFVIEPDGIKLDWRLSVANAGDTKTDPDHFIENYEVIRTIEGSELTPYVTLVKPVGTQGRTEGEGSKVLIDPPECQFLDTLGNDTGVTPSMRRALLPAIGEEEGLEAAQAWIKAFGVDEERTITYSVTPIDTAGVRGLPRSFVVDVPRPLATIHPAIGEIRAVQKPSDDTKTNGRQENDQPPPDLDLYLAINDQAWSDNAPAFVTIGNDKFDVDRIYRLVIDPEDLEPAGHYGSDGATSRVRGPGAWAPKKTADERTFDVNRKSTIGFDDPAIQQIEPEAKTLKLLRWAKIDLGANLNGTPPITIRQFLWTGRTKDVRVATRFSLETVLRFKKQNANEPPIEYPSSRVPLQVEHRIEASPQKDDAPQTVASLRPDALEWTVPLKLPPLGAGQIRAESGFARFRVPKPGWRLADASSALLLQRDADRRVLTTVTFSAIPDWAMAGSTKKVKGLHGASLAGFDLYELDLDELAPLDIDASDIAKNAKAWQRARRVARIQQLSRDDAQLVPAGNEDWQGWQAHYPSETQRLINARTNPPAGDSKPIRSAWYSDRESAAHFPERRPRLRLLPAPPENAIAALMQQGSPTRIVATVVPAKGGSVALPKLKLHRVDIARDGAAALRIDTPFTIDGDGNCKKVDGTVFKAKELRHLLLALGWEPFADADADKWRKDPSVLDGVTLTLRGDADFTHLDKDAKKVSSPKGTGGVDIPLDLRSPMHPLLEEVLGELSYDVAGDAAYRRFVVMPQPFTPMGVKDFDGFMAGTAPEADPYGWKILQAAGCATTVRLFDRDQETFVAPSRLHARVNDIVSAALDRWKTAHGNNYAPITAQPFAELFLRPGADRLAGPFDAIGDGGAPPLEPDDEALAFVQLSLRPRPVSVWHYMQQKFKFGKPVAPDDQFRIRRVCIRVPRKDADLDVARARGGAIAEVTTDTPTVLIEMPQNARNADELTIFFRTAGGIGAGDRPALKIVVEREQISDGSIVSNDFDLGPDQPFDFDGEWTPEISAPGSSLDPFARFDPLSAEKWADALTTNATAMAALRALQETLFGAMALTFSAPKQFAAAWVTWQQRLLDHAAVTTTNDPLDTQPFFALAAPVKASPWKLAADAEGSITLTFLHSDRWAHARVYAVKPIGRYHELLGGIGVDAEQKVETFDAALPDKLGYAVAVSPRTERIEPPMIVKSSLVSKIAASDDPENFVTELIVARHGEESLANSNRTLFARLGVPSSLLAFSRSYRMPEWPERLKGSIGNVLPDTLPERTAQLPAHVDDVQIDGAAIRALADEYPGLWKGADIWRIAPIPPHYRLIALASERAGIVVSDVMKVVQEEQPRRHLQDHRFADKAIALSFLRDGSARARLVIHHPLISHADLTPEAAKGWLGHGKKDDICWWPDPDVVYVLLRRRSEDKNKTFVTEEEDAEVRLVAQADDTSGAAIPIVVRARGTRYTSEVVNHDRSTYFRHHHAERRSPRFHARLLAAPAQGG